MEKIIEAIKFLQEFYTFLSENCDEHPDADIVIKVSDPFFSPTLSSKGLGDQIIEVIVKKNLQSEEDEVLIKKSLTW